MPARPPRALAWAAVVALFLLMALGNVVSATGSGLACPDWPLCHGRLIPPLRPDVLVEYGHRLAAAITSILLVSTILLAMRRPRAPGVGHTGGALLVLLGVQIGLGGVTVLLRLPHLISTAHLVTALLILAGLLVLQQPAEIPGRAAFPDKVRRLAVAGLVVLLAQLALGGYVRHTGAGLACPDFPLCSGDLLPRGWLAVAHWVHRWLGMTLLPFFIHLALAARRTPLARPGWSLAALGGLQVTLGILAVVLQLPPAVRAAHAAVGYALWGTLVWFSLRAGAWRLAFAPARAGRQARLEAAGTARVS
ncbi:MAG: COX15/CtaA family protein [Candidatus Rokubacteria bacterium]|nr:COX15/CtaA family protein [Candidatus Rokubacteria bacterium]MBI2527192.1 COX15/CtaA family protein [Candidatus Rokubacteria bacterium]MBI3104494.1 COX15/CtaA family protein [Candidatus Rokubacteria bacterium]